jgi:hypothetical protein
MIRLATAVLAALAFSASAFAGDSGGGGDGEYNFTMPSNNVECTYTPDGGTATYATADGLAELQCDRAEPSYVRIVMGASGKPKKYTNVGDASCCSANYILAYGEVWSQGPFTCLSAPTGLTCTRGSHGFSIAKKAIKTH